MGHKIWKHRGGSLVVEKYTGEVQLDHKISNDDQILTEVPPGIDWLRCLTDVSKATFPDISHEQFAKAFQSIDKHSATSQEMKLAIYTGMNPIHDFEKIKTYAKHGS
jgi:hypothetical protein